jgi:hypothetical protein
MSDAGSTPLAGGSEALVPPTKSSRAWWWMIFVAVGGVLLPLGAIFAEYFFRLCSGFFDPIPTGWHILILLIVPLANALAIWIYYRGAARGVRVTLFLLGIAIGASLVYAIQLIPLAPISVIGILAVGLGLLGLSPYFALAASIVCARRVAAMSSGRVGMRPLWGGAILAVAVLGQFIATNLITYVGLRMAVSNYEHTSRRGVALIRLFGNKNALLRVCYDLPAGVWAEPSISRFGRGHVTREKARDVYYRVTGYSFNSVPPPRLLGSRQRLVEDFEFDSDVGGLAVNSISRDVTLAASRMDAVVDPISLTFYTEWTLIFTNSGIANREARAEIALPPGGVVSRLTLWINGEEREAAFGARGQVRKAYQEVAVVQRRDPALVTTCGPDRILMQCFPIPPNDGELKVRIGVTSPLEPQNADKALLVLPHFIEHNFSVPESVKHLVLIKSNVARLVGGIRTKELPDAKLAGPDGTLLVDIGDNHGACWTPDPLDHKIAIRQTVVPKRGPSPRNVILVIDTSARMREHLPEIAESLEKLTSNRRVKVVVAADTVQVLPTRNDAPSLATEIKRLRCMGGVDNRPALIKAGELALRSKDSVILWIHGPQPLRTRSQAERLQQLWDNAPGSLNVIAVAAADGRNTILSDLERTGAIRVFTRRGSLKTDLERLFAMWSDGYARLVISRLRIPISQATGIRGSSHVARLWAKEEVSRRCATPDTRRLQDVAALAASYRLVTPVSGAVVLESQEQYEANKLKPVDPRSVPSVVPEPAGLLALGFGCAGMIKMSRRRATSSRPVRS